MRFFILGPVFLHNMFPFERFMGVVKNMYVTALGQKEASPWAIKQRMSLGFRVGFFPYLKEIGLPQSQYEGRLTGKGTLGWDSIICRDGHSWSQPLYTVLQNSTLVTDTSPTYL